MKVFLARLLLPTFFLFFSSSLCAQWTPSSAMYDRLESGLNAKLGRSPGDSNYISLVNKYRNAPPGAVKKMHVTLKSYCNTRRPKTSLGSTSPANRVSLYYNNVINNCDPMPGDPQPTDNEMYYVLLSILWHEFYHFPEEPESGYQPGPPEGESVPPDTGGISCEHLKLHIAQYNNACTDLTAMRDELANAGSSAEAEERCREILWLCSYLRGKSELINSQSHRSECSMIITGEPPSYPETWIQPCEPCGENEVSSSECCDFGSPPVLVEGQEQIVNFTYPSPF
jgi:hypothetical protein